MSRDAALRAAEAALRAEYGDEGFAAVTAAMDRAMSAPTPSTTSSMRHGDLLSAQDEARDRAAAGSPVAQRHEDAFVRMCAAIDAARRGDAARALAAAYESIQLHDVMIPPDLLAELHAAAAAAHRADPRDAAAAVVLFKLAPSFTPAAAQPARMRATLEAAAAAHPRDAYLQWSLGTMHVFEGRPARARARSSSAPTRSTAARGTRTTRVRSPSSTATRAPRPRTTGASSPPRTPTSASSPSAATRSPCSSRRPPRRRAARAAPRATCPPRRSTASTRRARCPQRA